MNEHYFMGAKTEDGFFNAFGEEIRQSGYFGYILKGGAGTGKSSLMKTVAAAFEEQEDILYYHCSSDPNSIDAVVLSGSGVYICDGTAPHVMECTYPGVTEKIINLGEFWNERQLASHKEEIVAATDENASLHKRASALQNALSDIYSGIKQKSRQSLLSEKLSAYSKRFVRKHLAKQKDAEGRLIVRQLSALTEYGCMTYAETLEPYEYVYVMKDSALCASAELSGLVMKQALELGHDVIACPNVLSKGSYEHILIPSVGLALVSDTPLTGLTDLGEIINMNRFYDREALRSDSKTLKLDTAMLRDIAEELYDTISRAKAVHDDIEKHYIAAMDFSSVGEMTDELIYEIRARNE